MLRKRFMADKSAVSGNSQKALAPSAQRAGAMIAVYGADGSGKSTLIQSLKTGIGREFSGVIVQHWRPNIVVRRKEGVPVDNPHGKKPRPGWTCLPRLALLTLDFIYGYIILYKPVIDSGHLVLFDRYYDDLFADPLRYRFSGSQRWVRLFGKWVPKPKINIYLDVDSSVAFARKGEVEPVFLQEILCKYRQMAARDPLSVVLNAEKNSDEVLSAASEIVDSAAPPDGGEREVKASGANRFEAVLGLLKDSFQDVRSEYKDVVYRSISLPRNQIILYGEEISKADAGRAFYDLYRPLKKSGLCYRAFQKVLVNWLPSRVVRVPGSFLDYLSEKMASPGLDCTFMMTQPGASSKLIIRCADGERKVLAYVKVGWRDFNRTRILNEASFLKKLEDQPLVSAGHSRLLWADEKNGMVITALKPIPGIAQAKVEFEIHQRISLELESRDAVTGRLTESTYWEQIRMRAEKMKASYARNVLDLVLPTLTQDECARSLRFGWAHGDYAPWNLRQEGGRSWVIDWEDARINAPVGLDQTYMALQSEIFLNNRSLFQAVRGILGPNAVDSNKRLLVMLILLEQFIRFYEESGRPIAAVRQYGSALILLSRRGWRDSFK